ncbi:DUF2029 domain-containing protein [Patescibacteria group bacterium]|nr:DUF2029 domain-containing protein [Patescibacteria group bacterium]MBU0963689.1 DUF2029 domain-containing protein [Patescibacteria group bacterium]
MNEALRDNNKNIFLSIEVIVFIILVINFVLTLQSAGTILNKLLNFLIFLFAGLYILISSTTKKKIGFIIIKPIKEILLLSFIFFIIASTLFSQIQYKELGSTDYVYHDGAIQTEIAFDYIKSGKNPYSETYYNTLLEEKEGYIFNGNWYLNPALEHYIYLPATFFISGSFNAIQKAIAGWSDLRILNFIYLLGSLIILWKIVGNHPLRNLVIILFALNPFFLRYFLEGRNDIIVLFWILAAFYLLLKNRFLISGLLFGIALSTKQFAWIFIPFILAFFMQKNSPDKKVSTNNLLKFIIPASIIAILFITPFVIWDISSFIDDTILYASGSSSGLNYPITGYGFSQIVTFFGVQAEESFPFWIIMAAVGLPVLFFMLKRVRAKGTIESIIVNTTIFILFTFLFSRFLNNNYLAFISQLLIIWLAFILGGLKSETANKTQIAKENLLE